MSESIIDTPAHVSAQHETARSPEKHRLVKLVVFLNLAAIVFVISAVSVRSILADRIPYISTFYYATPLPLLSGLAVMSALVNICIKHRRYTMVWCFAAVTLISWTGFESLHAAPTHSQNSNHKNIRIAFWNVGRGLGGWSTIVQEMQSWDADVIGIVEAGVKEGRQREFWQQYFPDYDVSMLGGEFVLLVKGTSDECTPGTFGPLGKYREIGVNIDGAEFDVMLIDISSAPFISRESTMNAMAELMSQKTDRPALLMGDFNTPTNSVHFAGLRQSWTNAFEAVGRGYAPTWPVPAPMLVLDQIWYNGKIDATHCVLEWSTGSDHRPVLVEIMPPK